MPALLPVTCAAGGALGGRPAP